MKAIYGPDGRFVRYKLSFGEWFGDFVFDFAGPCVAVFLVVAGLAIMSAGLLDGTQSLRARDAVFACEARNLSPIRKTFTTEVVCRPRNMGSDTLNVKAVSPDGR